MKSLKEYMAEVEEEFIWFTLSLEDYQVHILFEKYGDSFLVEAKRHGVHLGGIYSAQLHKVPEPGKEHIHVYAKGRQIFALNKDGTAHDSSHQTQIPEKAAQGIKSAFPSFVLPPGNFIESAPREVVSAVKLQILLG